MAGCSSRIKKLICRRIIGENGVNTILKRAGETRQELDVFGEPIVGTGPDGKWVLDHYPITIAPKLDKRDQWKTPEGGYPDPNKEYLRFYTAADTDVRVADKIVWPPSTDNEWYIDSIEANYYSGEHVISEIRCYRDGAV